MTIVANSRRLASDWHGAFEAVSRAKSYLSAGKVEPSTEAYLLSVNASLLGNMGHLEDAVRLADRAADICRSAGDLKGLATMKINAADTLLAASKPGEALLMAKAALSILPSGGIRMELLARSIVTESLVELGRLPEALKSYEATETLYEETEGELMLSKTEYLEGKLLGALGHARESEKLFRSAVDGMTELENYRLSFAFRFEFFESLFKRGTFGKAARLCQESIDLLQTLERIHPQMLQVWRDLLTAVKMKALTESHLTEMRNYLVRHWALPARRAPFRAEQV
jgi:tetratricopeptide (TPR) repeat protein